MTDIEKFFLGSELDKMFEIDRFDVNIHCSQNTNSRTYTEDIGGVFTTHHWKVIGNCLFNNLKPGLSGLFLVISKNVADNQSDIPSNATKLANIFKASGIQFQMANDDTLPKAEFYLAVGDAPP
jgi:hypothetical protein